MDKRFFIICMIVSLSGISIIYVSSQILEGDQAEQMEQIGQVVSLPALTKSINVASEYQKLTAYYNQPSDAQIQIGYENCVNTSNIELACDMNVYATSKGKTVIVDQETRHFSYIVCFINTTYSIPIKDCLDKQLEKDSYKIIDGITQKTNQLSIQTSYGGQIKLE